MSDLRNKTCQSCEGGAPALSTAEIQRFLTVIDEQWQLSSNGKEIARTFSFNNYYQTTAFVNAAAWIAHTQDHHADISFSYKQCEIRYSTHAIDALSENDFICAAKLDALLEA